MTLRKKLVRQRADYFLPLPLPLASAAGAASAGVSTTTTGVDGGYRLKIPTWWVGSRSYRVRSSTAASTEFHASVVPSYTPRGKATQFRYSFDTMTRWDPCTTIGYRVNARQGGTGAAWLGGRRTTKWPSMHSRFESLVSVPGTPKGCTTEEARCVRPEERRRGPAPPPR